MSIRITKNVVLNTSIHNQLTYVIKDKRLYLNGALVESIFGVKIVNNGDKSLLCIDGYNTIKFEEDSDYTITQWLPIVDKKLNYKMLY